MVLPFWLRNGYENKPQLNCSRHYIGDLPRLGGHAKSNHSAVDQSFTTPGHILGVDEPQHFAEIIGPDRSGVIEVLFTCENGKRGSNFAGNILLEFREGEKTVASVQYHCLGRSWTVFHHVKKSHRVNVDLSEVMDRVNNIKMQIHADVPIQSASPISR